MKHVIEDNIRFKPEYFEKQNSESNNERKYMTTNMNKTEHEQAGKNHDYVWWLI